eukprot:gene5555-7427_t
MPGLEYTGKEAHELRWDQIHLLLRALMHPDLSPCDEGGNSNPANAMDSTVQKLINRLFKGPFNANTKHEVSGDR